MERLSFALKPMIAALTAVVLCGLTLGAGVAMAADRFGINAQILFSSFPQSTWAANTQMMQQDGIQVVRIDAPWANTEPNAPVNGIHTYNWSQLDTIETLLASNHILWQPIIDFSAPWAASQRSLLGQPNIFSPPANDADYAAYAQAVVKRYGPGGTFWTDHPELTPRPVTAVEIWNEEDEPGFWQPQPDPAAYAAMYTAARNAIHQVAPSVQAITGGIAGQSTPYLQGMYNAFGGTSGHLDAVGLHPYAANPHDMYTEVVGLRQVLEQHGDVNVPLDLTEFGWPTGGLLSSGYTVISDSQRAQYVTRFTQAVARSNCGVDRIEPHTWMTPEQNMFNPDDWFGFVHPNLARSETENAYSATIGQLAPLAMPGPPSTSLCAEQLGVPAGTTTPPPQSQPQPLLPPLLSLRLRLKRLRLHHTRSKHLTSNRAHALRFRRQIGR